MGQFQSDAERFFAIAKLREEGTDYQRIEAIEKMFSLGFDTREPAIRTRVKDWFHDRLGVHLTFALSPSLAVGADNATA